ncbi:MAG: FIST N-terminal domain-containing protein [Blastocatellia bacterium]
MKIEQRKWSCGEGWSGGPAEVMEAAQVVFVFGSRDHLSSPDRLDELKHWFPRALIFGCSTAGEIIGSQVLDDSIVATAVSFEQTRISSSLVHVESLADSYAAGVRLGAQIEPAELSHVLVLSAGLNVNGTALIKGLTSQLPEHVTVTGGLAGDGARFESTLVICGQEVSGHAVAALSLYGQRLKVGYGSMGGWDSFGPERLVTKSSGNVLAELDHKSALELYKQYLGEHACELPASGLLFPLSLRTENQGPGLVRTILAIDEQAQSMTFAGDIPEGSYVRLMRANFDRLIDGAVQAGQICQQALTRDTAELALLISCVGRKLVLRQRIEEEVEGVREVLGDHTALMGFYSYGEISPLLPTTRCELHNQTMTITTFAEI